MFSFRLQFMAGIALLAVLCCKVWVKIETTDTGYQLARERQKTMELDMERRELDLQLSLLLRTDNLKKMASDRLGLELLDHKQARKIQY